MFLSIWLLAIFSAMAVVLVALYRLYLHPLASMPGPALAAVTRLYAFYFNIINKGTFYLEVERLHKIYGTEYILSSNTLFTQARKPYEDI